MSETVISDLSKFGWREWRLLREIIDAMIDQGLPENFHNDEVAPMFNTNSGFVFLTNSDYQACLMNGDKLEIWHTCSYCGHEGFEEDFEHESKNEECNEQINWVKGNINNNEEN